MLRKYKSDEWGNALDFDNIKIAKHALVEMGGDDNGKPLYDLRLKISSSRLRHAIFQNDHPFRNSMILHSKKLLNMSIASAAGLLRGYVFGQEGFAGLKRKSPAIITDAAQTAGALPTIDLHSTSGAKRTKENDDGASDTSLFCRETAGDVEYSFKGAIALPDLQFISLSGTFDRMAVNPDDFEALYRPHLEECLGSKVADPGFYMINSAVNAIPEEGILLTREQTALLVREFFKRLLALTITRNASLSGLQAKLVNDPITDKMDDQAGWDRIESVDDLSLKPEEIVVAFRRISDREAKSLMEDMTAGMARAKEVKRESREKKANAKKEKKKQKVLLIKFASAGIFPDTRRSLDKMYDLDGKTKRAESPRMLVPFKKLDWRHVSNVLHVLMGERPVPTIRKTLLQPDISIQEAAKKARVVIDTPCNERGYEGVETMTGRKSAKDARQTARISYFLGGRPVQIKGGLRYWTRLERMLGEALLNDLVRTVQTITHQRDATRSISAHRAIEILHDHYDSPEVRAFCNNCIRAKRTALVNIIDPKGNTESIAFHTGVGSELNNMVNSGPENIVRISGTIFVPLDEELIRRLSQGCGAATILEGGLAYIEGIEEWSENLVFDAEPVIEAPIQKGGAA
jgi:hypothetical protein